MAKYDAFGSVLHLGVKQVETATVVGTVTNAGDIHVVCTSAQIAGSPLQTVVAVLLNDTASMVAGKIRAALNLVAAITLNFVVGGSGPYVTLTRKIAAANEVGLNIDYHMDGATAGLTDDLTSTDTVAGVALTDIVQIVSIGGPSLAVDTEDVTTHDSTGAVEEHVATIIRSGEVSFDIEYDPVAATHDNTTGLISRLSSKAISQYQIVFPDAAGTMWTFDGWTSGFEPGEPHDGALTASVTVKVTGSPTLA